MARERPVKTLSAEDFMVLKPFATKLDEKVIEVLDQLARKTQIPKARLCRQAIEMLAAHYERQEEDLQLGETLRQSAQALPQTSDEPETVSAVS